MTFISFAQNGEDVILWRALQHIDQGFYIDVGACDPVTDSVTKAFYDRGWRGINIEPVRAWYERLQAQRPRDINLNVAAGHRAGLTTLHEIADSGLSTTSSDIATLQGGQGWGSIARLVPMLRLDDICAGHAPADIHFLKIDVEGAEAEVLAGLDLQRWRPWILMIEATTPNSPEPNHHAWESLVLAGGYVFAYFDGLNRYYLSREHAELIPQLAVQPNVFDDFTRAGDVAGEEGLAGGDAKLAETRQGALSTGDREHASNAELDRVRAELEQYKRQATQELWSHNKEIVALRSEVARYTASAARADALQQEIAQVRLERSAEARLAAGRLDEATEQVGQLRQRTAWLERDLASVQRHTALHLAIRLGLIPPLDGSNERAAKSPLKRLLSKTARRAHELRRRGKKVLRRLLGRPTKGAKPLPQVDAATASLVSLARSADDRLIDQEAVAVPHLPAVIRQTLAEMLDGTRVRR